MENKNLSNLRVGFHSIEILLKLSPENIKKIYIPANRNDERVLGLIAMAEKLSISVERKKSLVQHPEAYLKNEVSLGLSDLKKYEESIQNKNPSFLVIDNVLDPRNLGACIRSAAASNIAELLSTSIIAHQSLQLLGKFLLEEQRQFNFLLLQT